jgi:hypothetical protein
MQITNYIKRQAGARAALIAWGAAGTGLLALTIGFTLAAPLFGYAYAVRDMPVLWVSFGLCAAGIVILALPWMIRATQRAAPGLVKGLLWAMLAAGLAMRLVLFASEPVLEDDYQRYLWDGAVTANGLSPYEKAPEAAKAADPELMALGRLALDSGLVLGRVNHPELRTIYPPVAQGAFALAHRIDPWSLTAWRGLILAFDIISVALLLTLLRELGRSPLWAALYWWNPVVLKELFNSAHMDALIVPLVLGALILAIRKRELAATACLTLAAGAKIWPLIFLPLVWRGILDKPGKLAAAVALTAGACILFALPVLTAGLDASSGLIAYASKWKTNSALLPVLEGLARRGLDAAYIAGLSPGLVARAGVVIALASIILWQCRTAAESARDLAWKFFIVSSAAFLLTPAQFPWYYLWVLPMIACFPSAGLLVLTATLPLYYTAFYFHAHGAYEVFTGQIVWLIWLPAWGLLVWQARHWFASLHIPFRFPAGARETS